MKTPSNNKQVCAVVLVETKLIISRRHVEASPRAATFIDHLLDLELKYGFL